MTRESTPPTVAAVRERLEKATPGPWCVESCGEKGDGAHMVGVAFGPDDNKAERPLAGWLQPYDDDGKEIEYYRDEEVACCEHRSRNAGHNADLIAHAPTDLAFLLAENDRLRKALEEIASVTRLTATGDHTHCVQAIGLVGRLARTTLSGADNA